MDNWWQQAGEVAKEAITKSTSTSDLHPIIDAYFSSPNIPQVNKQNLATDLDNGDVDEDTAIKALTMKYPEIEKTLQGRLGASIAQGVTKLATASRSLPELSAEAVRATGIGKPMSEEDPQILKLRETFPEETQGLSAQQIIQNKEHFGNLLAQKGSGFDQFVSGVGKGLASTAMGLGTLGTRGLEAVTGVKAPIEQMEQQRQDWTKTKGGYEEAGKVAAQIGEFLAPVGVVGKIGKAAEVLGGASKLSKFGKGALNLGARVGAEGLTTGAVAAAQEGDLNQDVGTSAVIGGALPLVGLAAKGLGKVASEVSKHLASTFSGVPVAAIEHAISNPTAVQAAIKKAAEEGGDVAAQEIHKNAIEALNAIKSARTASYEKGLKEVQDSFVTMQNGKTYVKNIDNVLVPVNLTTKGIKDTITHTLKDFGAKAKGTALDFSEAAIDTAHANKLKDVVKRVYAWKDNSPLGINKLRQVIDSYKLGGINLGSSEKQFNAIIGNMRTNLSDYVGSRIDAVARMNKGYATQSKVIDDITRQLKTNSKDPNTALRKLLNVFNPKSTVYRPIVEQLGERGGKALMSDIAGLTMSKWTPEGLGKYIFGTAGTMAGIANPMSLAGAVPAAVLASPRIVGKAATTVGKLSGSKVPGGVSETVKAGIKSATSQR